MPLNPSNWLGADEGEKPQAGLVWVLQRDKTTDAVPQ